MLLKLLRFVVCVLAVTFVSSAKADAVNTVYFDGSYSFADSNGYGIPPYGGTLNGQTESFYCVDFSHEIQAGQSWYVNISSLTGSSFSSTRLGDQSTYMVMAYASLRKIQGVRISMRFGASAAVRQTHMEAPARLWPRL